MVGSLVAETLAAVEEGVSDRFRCNEFVFASVCYRKTDKIDEFDGFHAVMIRLGWAGMGKGSVFI